MNEPLPAPLVAVRDRREQVIQWLSEQFAQDTLDVEEFDRRLDQAHQATSIEALDRLVDDLPSMPAPAPHASTALAPAALVDTRPERKRIIAALGGVQHQGRWLVPRDLRVTAVMGGVSLDFREALLAPGVTRLHVNAVMGGVEIIVPPHVAVQADGAAIMGGFEDMHRAPATLEPDMPVLVISGLALMGGVAIETRLVGESERQARQRERRASKRDRQLAARTRKQLGAGDAQDD